MRVDPEPTLTGPWKPSRTVPVAPPVGQDGIVTTSQLSNRPPNRPPLRRPAEDRVLAGVAAGLAEHLGLHVNALRTAFVVTGLVGGLGMVAYLFLWAFVPESGDPSPSAGSRRPRRRVPEALVGLLFGGLALVLLGSALLLQSAGFDLRLDLFAPILVIGVGALFAWTQLDEATRRRWLPDDGPDRRGALARLALGLALAVAGLIALATQGRDIGDLWNVLVAVLVVLAGVSFLAAPWALRLWNDYRAEHAERVRATERADIAAHLHDSVLQTLALIQRRSDDPAQVTRLARAQERELRAWLYAGAPAQEETLATAVTRLAHEVEDLHGVPLDCIVTGDRPLDPSASALLGALREAMVNAVRHGAPPVSAYVEVGPREVSAFVRDHGSGFDPEAVPLDRLGVRESIVGRMTRHGGTARVRALDRGTEVSLVLPVEGPADPPTDPADSGAVTGRTGIRTDESRGDR